METFVPLLLMTSPIPSAAPVEPGHGSAYVLTGASLGGFDAQVGGRVGLPARFVLSAGGVIAGMVGSADLALRWNAYESEHFSVGPWVGYTGMLVGSDGTRGHGPTLGLALEGGGRVLRGDLSIAAVMWNVESVTDDRQSPVVLPLFQSSAGITARFAGRHSVRLGIDPGITPRLGYQYDFTHWSLGGGVALVNVSAPGVWMAGSAHW